MRGIRLILLACGIGLLSALVIGIGPGAIASSFAKLSWRLLVIVWFPFVLVTVFDTLGWQFAFARDSVPFRMLLATRMAGEAFNATTPTASIGGEGVKAWLLREHVSIDASLPSVIVAKTTLTIAQGLFLLLGIGVAASVLAPGSALVGVMQWMLVVEALAVGGFVLAQMTGMLTRAGRLLAWMGLLERAGGAEMLGRLDRALSVFYRREPGRLLLSTGCHFVGWVFSAFETYVILYFLGAPVSLATAIVIEAFSTGVRFATFMVPAHFGVLEGGHVAAFLALGLEAATGLSFSLARRVREVAWVGLGVLMLAARRSASPAVAPLTWEG
jgi:uncharacterized protein (TIRG00374 family)